MSRSARTALVIVVATVMASIATYGVYLAVSRIPVREVEVASTKIVVAIGTLPTGTQLQDKDLKLVAWPDQQPGSRLVHQDRGRHPPRPGGRGRRERAHHGEQAGTPVVRRGSAADHSARDARHVGPRGRRRWRRRVRRARHARGRRGHHQHPASEDKPMSRTVLGNVLVLTSGTRIDQEQGRKGEAQPTTVVTLAVTPDDAERIALARRANGRISLALRNPLDVDPTQTAGIKLDALMTGPGGAAPRRPRRRSAWPAPCAAAGTGRRAAGSQAIRRRNHPRRAAQGRDAALVMRPTPRKAASTMTRSIRHLLATACTALVVLSWPGSPRAPGPGPDAGCGRRNTQGQPDHGPVHGPDHGLRHHAYRGDQSGHRRRPGRAAPRGAHRRQGARHDQPDHLGRGSPDAVRPGRAAAHRQPRAAAAAAVSERGHPRGAERRRHRAVRARCRARR